MVDDFERIARAVISQALSDAGLGMERGYRKMVSSLDRDEARAFLFAESGAWRQAREFWCTLADLCPERLSRRSREMLDAAGKPKPAPVAPPPPSPRAPARPRIMRKRSAPMPGTKLSDVFYLISRPEGVAIEELMQSLGWKRATAQTAISELRMFGIVCQRGDDGRHRVVSLP